MVEVVLFQPEIPPNTGNVMRLCANAGASLHLIEPLGFRMDDKSLRRAGLDYSEWHTVCRYATLDAYLLRCEPRRVYAFSTKASRRYSDAEFTPRDALLFGPETRGLPVDILFNLPPEQRLTIPMVPGSRSLNLSNSVAIALYEVWRQQGFTGAAETTG